MAAYCVYNTLEAPEKEDYKPSGSGAFSKEITYCLYNGCRYRGGNGVRMYFRHVRADQKRVLEGERVFEMDE